MNLRLYSLIGLLCFWLFPLWAQPENSCCQTIINTQSGRGTLRQWFQWLEQKGNLQLSYNTSVLDMDQNYTLYGTGQLTVTEFLTILLKDFKLNIQETSSRKILLQATPRKSYTIEGSICEKESKEKLLESYVLLKEIHSGQTYTAIAENGTFRLNILEGDYNVRVHYLGYQPYEHQVSVSQNVFLNVVMLPISIELKEATVRSCPNIMELDESQPSNKLTYTNTNLFSQMNILPGVIGAPMGVHFQVNGGGDDENLLLVDGTPLYHYGHMNTMMSPFNGDAIKSVTFHRNFFPTQYEGRLSSVTDIRMKEGNKQEHQRTLSIDMPAASIMLEGPIIKNKLSYLVGARRSWLDFFDELVNDDLRMNHSYSDYQAKLSFDATPVTSVQFMAYHADDDYHYPIEKHINQTIMHWRNQLYQLGFQTLIGKNITLSSSIAYTAYSNKALEGVLEMEDTKFLESGIRSTYVTTTLSCQPDPVFHASWGFRFARENYKMAVFGDTLMNQNEPVTQLSIFYDNLIRINARLSAEVGINYVLYAPDHYTKHHSIQPRISLKYGVSENDLLYAGASRMEQFYHYICLNYFALPTDFRMPSIEGFRPRSSEHYEIGWKHFLKKGYIEASAFYKTRRHVLALRPEAYPTDNQWEKYIMSGNGHSYGAKAYITNTWKRISLQASYAYIRSKEWFPDLRQLGKLPSLYDIPHAFAAAISYRFTKHSSVSIGGEIRSGKIMDLDYNMDVIPEEQFRSFRESAVYRVDAGYGYQRTFKKSILAFRLGLYNIVGNPPEEEIQSFYFINFQRQCLPYAAISFKF